MKNNHRVAFFLAAIVTLALLCLSSFDEKKVAAMRWEYELRQQQGLKEDINARCSTLSAKEEGAAEKVFLERFSPVEGDHSKLCQVTIKTAHSERFGLRSQWNFLLHIETDKGALVADRDFTVEFPTPVCLFPLCLFVLACLFGLRSWGLAWTAATYLFLLGGGNLIHATRLALKSALLTLTTDQTFSGLLLLTLWMSLYQGRVREQVVTRTATTPWESFINRLSTFFIGLWNPGVYTLFGRLLYPLRGGILRLVSFLDAQFFVACISLYLLSVDVHNLRESLQRTLLLPRYFSFAGLLFFAISHWPGRPRRQVLLWHLPRFWQNFALVAAVLVFSWRHPTFSQFPVILRVGVALVVSELLSPRTLSLSRTGQRFLPLGGALFLACFVGVLSSQSGMMDLALVLLEPRLHPTVFVFFTFWAGLTLGFMTGSFSTTFFALLAFFVKSHELPLIKGALIDGILAGSLLSPFSVYNLFPSVLFRLPMRDMIAFRFRQLAFPLMIGSVIYTVSAINAVAILQPVTFVFLCLAAAAFQFRKTVWHLSVPVSFQGLQPRARMTRL